MMSVPSTSFILAARWIAGLVSAALAAGAVARAGEPVREKGGRESLATKSVQLDSDSRQRLPAPASIDAKLVLGYESCAKCHAAEVETWKRTPHHTTFLTLHQQKEAVEIARKMGVASIKRGQVCIDCHYTPQAAEERTKAISGVSCESCHGPAQNWLKLHSDYGGPAVAKAQETVAHKSKRISDSISAGMRNPHNLYLFAQSCYRCHTVPNEKLVNVGGHKAGSLDFELVAWSQGMVRHNFLESNGKENRPLDAGRLRVMFVVGVIADLEFSLRATAEATEKATYGITSAQRADRAAKRLMELQGKINHPQVEQILSAYKGVKLKLNNRGPLLECANRIAALGEQFAAEASGDDLAEIQSLLPPVEKYKHEPALQSK